MADTSFGVISIVPFKNLNRFSHHYCNDAFLTLISIFSKVFYHKNKERKKIRNRYNQISHLTQNSILANGKHKKHHIQESQEVSPFTAGDYKAARNCKESMTEKHET